VTSPQRQVSSGWREIPDGGLGSREKRTRPAEEAAEPVVGVEPRKLRTLRVLPVLVRPDRDADGVRRGLLAEALRRSRRAEAVGKVSLLQLPVFAHGEEV